MSEYLNGNYNKVIETDHYICAVGNIPIALCAHMDTVWEGYKGAKKHLYYDKHKECMWCPEGAGFDDKIGIFLIVKIIESGLRPHIILCMDEEIGAVGAGELAKAPCPFSDLKYCVELDRMGSNDCVFYSCDNPDFVKHIETFGFKMNYGSFTDICQFCPAWGVAGVNLSVGYVDEHTTCERLYVKSMLNTLKRVKKILTAKEIPFFGYIPYKYNFSLSKAISKVTVPTYPVDYDDDEYGWWSSFEEDYTNQGVNSLTKCECYKCGNVDYTDTMIKVLRKDKSYGWCCYNCLDNTVAWCDYCKEPFEIEKDEIEYVCPNCREMLNANRETAVGELVYVY